MRSIAVSYSFLLSSSSQASNPGGLGQNQTGSAKSQSFQPHNSKKAILFVHGSVRLGASLNALNDDASSGYKYARNASREFESFVRSCMSINEI